MCFLNIKACQHILLHQIHKIIIFKKASYDHFKTHCTGKKKKIYTIMKTIAKKIEKYIS